MRNLGRHQLQQIIFPDFLDIVRGKAARWAEHDPRPCQIPPDWSGGYTSLFALQQGEEWSDEQLQAVAEQNEEIRSTAA